MTPRVDVVIVGAGVVGMTMAALLATGRQRNRLRITLVDAGAEPVFSLDDELSLRVSALSCGSMTVFGTLGLRERIISTRACPYRDMRVWDAAGAADSTESLRFAAAEFALPELGYIVENALLQDCLLAALRAHDVSVRFDASIQGIERSAGGHTLRLAGGEELPAALLIGADGAASRVRESAGIAVTGWEYGQMAIVAHAVPQHAHRHTAWQRFLPDGPLALLPLCDGRVSIVWSTTHGHAVELLDGDRSTFSAAVSAASDRALGTLDITGGRASFPLRAQYARQTVARGIALIGDAAHTVHPLAGQGGNLGIADAACLADILDNALANDQHPADLPVLRRYERARRGANQTMLYFVDGINRLFATDSGLLARLRGRGMRIFNNSGPVRRHAVRVALGLDDTGRH